MKTTATDYSHSDNFWVLDIWGAMIGQVDH